MASDTQKPTILCVFEQPTQFDPPLWRALERRGTFHPVVWYGKAAYDREMDRMLAWGDDLSDIDAHVVPREQVVERFTQMQPTPLAVICERWTLKSTWLLAWQCMRRGIPVLLPSDRIPETAEPFMKKLRRRILRAATPKLFRGHITTGSLGVASLMQDGIPQDRIARALYAIDVDLFQRRLAQQQSVSRDIRNRWPEHAPIVIAVAKHVERESPLLIIETFAALRSKRPDAKLLFVGDGPMRGAIEERIAHLGLGDSVFMAGYVPYADLPGYYGAADVFLHVAAFGPWEISVSEAMACGVPAVTTANIGSSADLTIVGQTGAVASEASAEALADKIVEVHAFPDREATRRAVIASARTIDVSVAAAEIERLIFHLYGSSIPTSVDGGMTPAVVPAHKAR